MKRTVLITGSSSGIGKATARYFAEMGWNVVATMRNPEKEEELSVMANVLVTRLNLQDLPSINRAIEEGVDRFGTIHVLINNAGYGQYGLFEAAPREKIQEQFDINLFGLMDVTRAVLPHFRQNQSGLILNVSSGAGIFTLPMISLYCASKFALEGFSEALSYELASQNIIVKIIQPHGGVTHTGFHDKSAKERAVDPTLTDYDVFAKKIAESFVKMSAARTTEADDVAHIIYEAATDGTARLRYLVGNDTRGFIKARQTLSEEEYIAFMRSKFI